MTKVCLECATPKFMAKAEKGMTHCRICQVDTHTINGEARRPQCHDCKYWSVKCTDGLLRPALDYGFTYISQGGCAGGDAGLRGRIVEVIGPLAARYEDCDGFEQHWRAPKDGRPNPLSLEERREWREYLKMPTAFWLEPNRWKDIRDSHKEKFWAHQPSKTEKVTKTVLGIGAIAMGLLLSKKAVDDKKPGATLEQTTGDR